MVDSRAVRWQDAFPTGRWGYDPKNKFDHNLLVPEDEIVPSSVSSIELDWIVNDRVSGSSYAFDDEPKISMLFPSIIHIKKISSLELSIPIMNVLGRAGISSMEHLLNLTFAEFLKFGSAGLGKTTQFASDLVRYVLNQIHYGTFWHDLEGDLALAADIELNNTSVKPRSLPRDPVRVVAENQLVKALTDFAFFQHYRGLGMERLAKVESTHSAEIIENEYNQALANVSTEMWLSGMPVPTLDDLVTMCESVFAHKPTELALLRQRLFDSNPDTLEKVGSEFGLTRERIRQLEAKLAPELETYFHEDRFLIHAVRAVQSFCITPISAEELFALMPTLNEKSESGVRVIDFISFFAKLEFEEGWFCNSFKDFNASLEKLVELSTDELGLIDRATLQDGLDPNWGAINRERILEWMEFRGFYRLRDKLFLASNLPQCAFFILAIEKKPMTGHEILDAIAIKRSVKSLENALSVDGRFIRVTRKEWALTDWGVGRYAGIKELIAEHIDSHGSTHIDELIALFSEKYKVQPTSIKAYASSGQFATVDGYVKRAAIVRTSRKGLVATKNLYRTHEGYALRLSVTADRLRGSGGPCPSALVSLLGVPSGTKKIFKSDTSEISITNGAPTPTISSVRKIIESLNLKLDDHFLLFFSDTSVSARKVKLDVEAPDLLAELAGLEYGLDIQESLSFALGQDETVPIGELKEIAVLRKEMDLAGAIEALSSQATT